MRIVYLSQFYYPEPHSIHRELAETLSASGHEVVVVTSYPNYPTGRIYEGWKQKIFGQWESMNGVSVLRCPVWPSHSKTVLVRGMHFISFTLSSIVLILFRVPRADVFLVHHPPPSLAVVAWLFKRGNRCPYVFRMADLWPEFIAGAGVSKSRFLLKAVESVMRFIYRTAARIVVPSPGFKKRLVEKGVGADKISVIPNYADEATYFPGARDKAMQRRLGIADGDTVILYAGNIGAPQRIDVLADSMKMIAHRNEIKLIVIGDGSCRKTLEQKCLHEGIASVTFFDQMPPEEVNRFYSIADALFIQLEDRPIWNDTIPSKIYAYMLAGRPIIAALKGDGADVVAESSGGYICEPGNAQAIADCIVRLADMPSADREIMGRNNFKHAIENSSKDVMVKKLEAVLVEVIKK